jgi:photosystem II stability/assembly factor-like uncharacterized protein
MDASERRLGVWKRLVSGDQFDRRDFCWNCRLQGVYRSTDNGDSWTLANTGLTSTDIAGLGINNNGHIFAATRSIMGEGGGMFRSTDNCDSWTEQNNGFTAFDANAVTFNSAGYVFTAAAGEVFRSTNDGGVWTNISSGLIPVDGNVWALAVDSGDYAYAGRPAAEYFARPDQLDQRPSETKASAHAGTSSLSPRR